MQLKVDKLRLMEICGTSDTEFGNVSLELQLIVSKWIIHVLVLDAHMLWGIF